MTKKILALAVFSVLAVSTHAGVTLTGKVAIGFDSIPGASAGTGVIPALSTPNALSLRYWQSENLAWDLLAAADFSTQPGGTDAAGNAVDNTTAAWGAGVKAKYNWKRPSEYVALQVVGRASYASLAQDVTNPLTGRINQTTNTFNLFLGLGFEAFIPAWEALSVEAFTGASVSSLQTKAGEDQVSQSGSAFSLVGEGFTPLNIALHVYF